MEYTALMVAPEGTITEQEKLFVDLHKEILFAGNQSATYFVEMAKKLKEMRDGKLYKAASFETFGEYTEAALNIKERMAYNYIRVFEKLPKEFLQSNAKIGVTKLTLLLPLTMEERERIVEENDVESIKVRELETEIEKIKGEKQQLEFSCAEEMRKMEKDIGRIREEKSVLELKISEANEKAKETEKLKKEYATAVTECDKAKKELEDLKKAPKEVEVVPDPLAEGKIQEAEKRVQEVESEMEALKKKLAVASDENMIRFKEKFKDLQRIGAEMITLIDALGGDRGDRCKTAMKSVVEAWKL